MRLGNPRYGHEVEELMQRLKATGIILIVIKGKRNKDDVEFTTVAPPAWIPFTAGAMAQTALAMMRNLEGFNPEVKRL